jgi:flagellar motor switch protein FliN/FliY
MSDVTEFDEISISAICEIMNQMMGSAASALATFLGTPINISPPEILESTDKRAVQEKFASAGADVLTIAFDIQIEDLVNSEFISVLEPNLAKEIIRMSLGENAIEEMLGEPLSLEATTEHILAEDSIPDIAIIDEPPVAEPVQAATIIQPAPDSAAFHEGPPPAHQVYVQAPSPLPPAYAQAQPKPIIQAVAYSYPELQPEQSGESGGTKDNNLELIMSVPVQITVELGKTRRKIKDIAEFAPGNIIELDRQAGDQVDIVANGRLIAKGDVVVVDDNYSVRITEIMRARDAVAELR